MHSGPSSAQRHDEPVLQFESCGLPLGDGAEEVFSLDLVLRPGELILLQTEDVLHEEAVSQASCGLLEPVSGRVTFRGRDWQAMAPDWSNASRGRIGIVFRQDSWVPHLSMMENIILAQLHHTRRPVDEICLEAARWATRFGLPGLPRDVPAAVSPADREAANLVRAFLGAPSLIVVEHLATQPSAARLQHLVNAMREARERGAAILWLTQDMTLGLNESIPATQRLRLGGTWQDFPAQGARESAA
ncbi:ATP-binding cassette domain-containing protein [Pelagibius sp. 7325]|uniref:ATP-binding cassette domain-containing protein n=1 Tax=Pelagibius sp. 7325 TaxID=3131994 RepID=UPI0030EC3118